MGPLLGPLGAGSQGYFEAILKAILGNFEIFWRFSLLSFFALSPFFSFLLVSFCSCLFPFPCVSFRSYCFLTFSFIVVSHVVVCLVSFLFVSRFFPIFVSSRFFLCRFGSYFHFGHVLFHYLFPSFFPRSFFLAFFLLSFLFLVFLFCFLSHSSPASLALILLPVLLFFLVPPSSLPSSCCPELSKMSQASQDYLNLTWRVFQERFADWTLRHIFPRQSFVRLRIVRATHYTSTRTCAICIFWLHGPQCDIF